MKNYLISKETEIVSPHFITTKLEIIDQTNSHPIKSHDYMIINIS